MWVFAVVWARTAKEERRQEKDERDGARDRQNGQRPASNWLLSGYDFVLNEFSVVVAAEEMRERLETENEQRAKASGAALPCAALGIYSVEKVC